MCVWKSQYNKTETLLWINDTVRNVFASSFTLSDNSEYLSLLSTEVASNGIVLLNTGQLTLLQTVLLEQIRLFSRRHQLMIRNEFVLSDINHQLILDESFDNHIWRRHRRQLLRITERKNSNLLGVARQLTAKHQNHALDVLSGRLLQLRLKLLSVDLRIDHLNKTDTFLSTPRMKNTHTLSFSSSVLMRRVYESNPHAKSHHDGYIIQNGRALGVTILHSQFSANPHFSQKCI